MTEVVVLMVGSGHGDDSGCGGGVGYGSAR